MHIENKSFKDQYIQPVIDHPISKLTYSVVVEVIKIIVALKLVEIAGIILIQRSSKWTAKEVFVTTIVAPLFEEVFFRGMLQGCIKNVQYFYYKGQEPTEEQKLSQQQFRIHTTALIFGLAHLANGNNLVGSVIQCTWSYTGGVVYGSLSEKYHSLSASILAHGLNNTLAVAGATAAPQYRTWFLLAVIVNKAAIYLLFVRGNLDEYLIAGANHAMGFCAKVPGHATNFFASKQGEENAIPVNV